MSDPVSYVIYNSKRIIPAPFLTFNKQYQRSSDGTAVGVTHTVTLTGKLVACKGWTFTGDGGGVEFHTGGGYPADDSSCCKFQNLLDMQEKFRELFHKDNDYHWFEVAFAGNSSKKWLARVQGIDFKEGPWVEYVDYSVTLEIFDSEEIDDWQDNIDNTGTEKWDVQFQPEDGGVYKLTHTLTATSKAYAKDEGAPTAGWKKAKHFVDERLAAHSAGGGIDPDIVYNATGFSIDGYAAYDYTQQFSLDEVEGVYSATETWTLAKNAVIRTVMVEATRTRDADARVKVSGNFKAFADNKLDVDGTTNCDAAWTAYTAFDTANGAFAIAQTYYNGFGTLSNCPVNKTVQRTLQQRGDASDTCNAPQTRIVEFSYEYSDAPSPADTEISIETKASKQGKVYKSGAYACPHIVNISGSIQGQQCDANKTKIQNADDAYALLDFDALATATGVTGLRKIGESKTRNERKGTISFNVEYSDDWEGGLKKTESITEAWDCDRRGGDGAALVTFTVEGTIEALCDVAWGTVVAAIPDPDDYNYGTLVRKSITKNEREGKVSYSYTFHDDDEWTVITTIEVTKREQYDGTCEHHTTVQVTFDGKGCSNTVALQYAEAALVAFSPNGYEDSDEVLISKSVSKNYNGKITATWEYTNLYESGLRKSETRTEAWDCNTRGSDGEPLTTITIDGTIEAMCDIVVDATLAPDSSVSGQGVTGYLIRKSVGVNEHERKVTYSYVYSSDTGRAKTEVETTTKQGPERCEVTHTTVQVTITGNACKDADAKTNAEAEFANFNPAGYVSNNSCQLAYSKTVSTSGKISATYEYSTECVAETSISITESYTNEDCGYKHIAVSGSIKGKCIIGGKTAIETADTAYGNLNLSDYCTGSFIISKSKTRNEREGTIQFQLECQDRDGKQYTDEQTVTVRYDIEQGASVTIEGQIVPLCDINTGSAGQIAAGLAAWATVEAGIAALATANITDADCEGCSVRLKSRSVTKSTINGKISYSYTYGCSTCDLVPGAQDVSVEIKHVKPAAVIAIVPILGRTAGPLVQDKGTKTIDLVEVNISVKFKPSCNNTSVPAGTSAAVDGIISGAASCDGNEYTIADSESWNPCTGRYTRSVTKICEIC